MPGAIHDVSLAILRKTRDKGDAFYPRVDAGEMGIDRDRLDAALDRLRLDGFLEIADWAPAKGQGYRLTDAGRQAVDRPALLNQPAPKLVLEEISTPQTDWDKGDAVRRALAAPPWGVVGPAIIALNVLVFLGNCLYLAAIGFPVMNYISGGRIPILPGSLDPRDVFWHGQYWELFTYMFVHGGLLHIGFNMYALGNLSRPIEAWMGIFRYLALYIGCGLIAGVAVLVLQPVATVGASGAICGLFSSLATWIYMNRRHLPPQYLQQVMRSFTGTIIIMVIISLPGNGMNVSWSAHLGGAIGGILMTPPLDWLSSRSPIRNRILGVVMLLVIAAICFVLLEHAQALNPIPRRLLIDE